jgi:outer membrane murein-binding lipoprotein Lpp
MLSMLTYAHMLLPSVSEHLVVSALVGALVLAAGCLGENKKKRPSGQFSSVKNQFMDCDNLIRNS